MIEPGSRAVLTGLQNKPELLNHRVVVVVRYLNDQDRYKVKPVGKEARRIFPTPHLAVRPANLKRIPPSAFLLDNRNPEGEGFQGNVPLECQIALDGFGKVGIRVVFSDFLGIEALKAVFKKQLGYDDEDLADPEEAQGIIDSVPWNIVTSPVYDQYERESLGPKEVAIARAKHTKLYDTMIDYEVIKDTSTGKTASIGMWKDVHVCKILFDF
jgi:hypothetical protein